MQTALEVYPSAVQLYGAFVFTKQVAVSILFYNEATHKVHSKRQPLRIILFL